MTRRVTLVLVVVVAAVIAASVISAYVPPLDDFLRHVPVVIVGLVVVTVAVLFFALRPRRL